MTLSFCLTTAVSIRLVNYAHMLLDTKAQTSTPNEPKMIQKTTKSKLSHVRCTSIHRATNFNPLRSAASRFRVTSF